MNIRLGFVEPVSVSVPSADRRIKKFRRSSSIPNYRTNIDTSHSASPDTTREIAHQGRRIRLTISQHPSRKNRYQILISDDGKTWAYPIVWRKSEVRALVMMARETISSLDLSLSPKGPPVEVVGWLHQLIEQLFPSVERVAAMAQEVTA